MPINEVIRNGFRIKVIKFKIIRKADKMTLKTLVLLLLTLPVFASESTLCDPTSKNQISFSKVIQSRNSDEISLITWNAHKLSNRKFMPDLVALSKEADIILIQEAMHNADLQNTFSNSFDFSFSFNKSFCTSDKHATGVMSASRYLLQANSTLVSPDFEPITNTPKVSGYSTVDIPEIGLVHIINTHGLNFDLGSKFHRQIDNIAAFVSRLHGPVIWAGDFNTWSGGRQKYLDKKTAELGLVHIIPQNDNRTQKLDHVYIRGLDVIDIQILENITSSDHLPIKAVFRKI